MVTDSLQNLEQYRGLHKNMDTVIDFLKKCDLTALPDGKTVIDGERVFVNVMEADLREAEGAEYEYHKRYADLQIDISGSEYWEWTDKAEFTDTFQEASDCGLAAGRSRCGGTGGRKLCFIPAGRISQTKLQKRITHTCEKSSY